MKKSRYSEEDIKKVVEDLEEKIDACYAFGFGEIGHVLNDALNMIEELWKEVNE